MAAEPSPIRKITLVLLNKQTYDKMQRETCMAEVRTHDREYNYPKPRV
jgi:hypothetical protein